MTQFDQQYQEALRKIMSFGYEEYNERTKRKTRILPGITFELDQGFPLLSLRKIPIKTFVAEQFWFLMGSQDPDQFLNKFTKVWEIFREDDGKIAAAYGHRWRHYFGRDQIHDLLQHLKSEPHSRQGVVIMWDPATDGLYGEGLKGVYKKNVPCPFTFTVNIIGGALHFHLMVRSNDMVLGCPHDVAGFALLQRILAAKLGIAVGKYTHSISNAHIYDNHYEAAWEMIERKSHQPVIEVNLESDFYDKASKGDELLLAETINLLSKQYYPLPPIKNLVISA